jgi:secondary thiamine-phosphate synthase enzyme
MKTVSKTLKIETKKKVELIDITNEVENFVRESNIKNGFCLIFAPHATAAIIANENEKGLINDIIRKIKEEFPQEYNWEHDRIDDNAYAHIASSFIGASKVFPIIDGKLIRGTWQNIFLVELDGPRFIRNVILQIIGE